MSIDILKQLLAGMPKPVESVSGTTSTPELNDADTRLMQFSQQQKTAAQKFEAAHPEIYSSGISSASLPKLDLLSLSAQPDSVFKQATLAKVKSQLNQIPSFYGQTIRQATPQEVAEKPLSTKPNINYAQNEQGQPVANDLNPATRLQEAVTAPVTAPLTLMNAIDSTARGAVAKATGKIGTGSYKEDSGYSARQFLSDMTGTDVIGKATAVNPMLGTAADFAAETLLSPSTYLLGGFGAGAAARGASKLEDVDEALNAAGSVKRAAELSESLGGKASSFAPPLLSNYAKYENSVAHNGEVGSGFANTLRQNPILGEQAVSPLVDKGRVLNSAGDRSTVNALDEIVQAGKYPAIAAKSSGADMAAMEKLGEAAKPSDAIMLPEKAASLEKESPSLEAARAQLNQTPAYAQIPARAQSVVSSTPPLESNLGKQAVNDFQASRIGQTQAALSKIHELNDYNDQLSTAYKHAIMQGDAGKAQAVKGAMDSVDEAKRALSSYSNYIGNHQNFTLDRDAALSDIDRQIQSVRQRMSSMPKASRKPSNLEALRALNTQIQNLQAARRSVASLSSNDILTLQSRMEQITQNKLAEADNAVLSVDSDLQRRGVEVPELADPYSSGNRVQLSGSTNPEYKTRIAQTVAKAPTSSPAEKQAQGELASAIDGAASAPKASEAGTAAVRTAKQQIPNASVLSGVRQKLQELLPTHKEGLLPDGAADLDKAVNSAHRFIKDELADRASILDELDDKIHPADATSSTRVNVQGMRNISAKGANVWTKGARYLDESGAMQSTEPLRRLADPGIEVPNETVNAALSGIVNDTSDYRKNPFALYTDLKNHVDRVSIVDNAKQALTDFQQSHRDFFNQVRDAVMKSFKTKNPADSSVVQRMNTALEALAKSGDKQAQEWLDRMDELKEAKNKPVLPITKEQALQRIDAMEQAAPELKNAHQNLMDAWDKFQTERVRGGSVSGDTYAALKQKYPNYAPSFRELSKDMVGSVYPGAGYGHMSEGAAFKTATGSERALKPFAQRWNARVNQMLRVEARNNLYASMIKKAQARPLDAAKAGIRILPTVPDEVLNDLKEAARGGDDIVGLDTVNGKVVTISGQKLPTITAMIDGKPVTAVVRKDISDALQFLEHPKGTDEGVAAIRFLNKFPMRMIKGTAVRYSPSFQVRNILRDLPTAMIQSAVGTHNFLAAMPDAARQMATGGNDWLDFLALGGRGSGYVRNETGFSLGKILSGVENVTEATEMFPRFTEYLASVRKGGGTFDSKLRGIYNAAEVTTNFSRTTPLLQVVDSVLPFANASVQGWDKFFSTVTKHPLQTAIRGAAIITAPDLALHALNDNNPNWQNLDPYVKDNYFCIPNYFGPKDESGNPETFIKLPKDREFGFLLGTTFDWMVDAAQGKSSSFGSKLQTMLNISPVGGSTSTFTPAINAGKIMSGDEDVKNWNGQRIIPKSEAGKLLPQDQYDTRTSGVAKTLGKQTGTSPRMWDYLGQSYLSDLWSALQGQTAVSQKNKNPLTNLFVNKFSTDSAYSSDWDNRFYDALDKWERQAGSDKKNKSPGYSASHAKYLTLNRYASTISDLYNKAKAAEDVGNTAGARAFRLRAQNVEQTALGQIGK